MGAVFLIRRNTGGDQVTLKLMLPRVAVQPEARERFLRETDNTRALSHHHVVQLRDAAYAHGTFFFTGTDGARITKSGDFGLAKTFDLAGLSSLTATGSLMGTPGFTPRQQDIEFKYAKPEDDVWAMAATFYHRVTGALPRDFPPNTEPWSVVLMTRAVPIRQRGIPRSRRSSPR